MLESVATAPVLAALAENACPLCTLRRQAESALLESFFREMVMDGRCREALMREGLCSHHLQLILAAPDKLGGALALKALVEAHLCHPGAARATSCYICGFLARTEGRHAGVLLDLFDSGGEGRRAIEAAPAGFCLPHLDVLEACRAPRQSSAQEREFREYCGRTRQKVLQELDRDLGWFIRKFDYRMAGEPWRGAEDAVERAVRALAGLPGLRL